MKKFLILTATSATLALTLPLTLTGTSAFAGDDANCGNTSGQKIDQNAVKKIATGQGYDVRRIKTEGSCYEIYAISKTGERVELLVNPVSGKIVSTKDKS